MSTERSTPATPLPPPCNWFFPLLLHMVLTAAALRQVRYTAGRPAEDRSGFTLNVGAEPLPLAAGMLTFASLFTLPPKEPAFKVRHLPNVAARGIACNLPNHVCVSRPRWIVEQHALPCPPSKPALRVHPDASPSALATHVMKVVSLPILALHTMAMNAAY